LKNYPEKKDESKRNNGFGVSLARRVGEQSIRNRVESSKNTMRFYSCAITRRPQINASDVAGKYLANSKGLISWHRVAPTWHGIGATLLRPHSTPDSGPQIGQVPFGSEKPDFVQEPMEYRRFSTPRTGMRSGGARGSYCPPAKACTPSSSAERGRQTDRGSVSGGASV